MSDEDLADLIEQAECEDALRELIDTELFLAWDVAIAREAGDGTGTM